MDARFDKLVYGAYTVSSTIGEVVGYAAAADDLKITEMGTSETQTAAGVTVQRTVSNPGKSASGTLVLTRTGSFTLSPYQTGYIGQIIMITNNGDGSTRPYCVTAWDEAPEADTGRRIATFTAESEDSMVDAYLAGPVDPATGTAGNYVFGGIIGPNGLDTNFDPSIEFIIASAELSGENITGNVYMDGNKWRCVLPKASNTGTNDDWVVTFGYTYPAADEEVSFGGSGFGGTLASVDGKFDFVVAVNRTV